MTIPVLHSVAALTSWLLLVLPSATRPALAWSVSDILYLDGYYVPDKSLQAVTPMGQTTTWLSYSSQALTGTLPSRLVYMTRLEDLDLARNKITGTIPTEWNALTQLTALALGTNLLEGPIPDWSGMTNAVLYLDNNPALCEATDGSSLATVSKCSDAVYPCRYPACVPTCTDGLFNGDEAGVDCGGASCPACTVNPACQYDACSATVCGMSGTQAANNQPCVGPDPQTCSADGCPACSYAACDTATCRQSANNAPCTGPSQTVCADTSMCLCQYGACDVSECVETAINQPCAGVYSRLCASAGTQCPCQYGACDANMCQQQSVLTDCIGPQIRLCTTGLCATSCADGSRNGDETGVDCGGSCTACSTGNPGSNNDSGASGAGPQTLVLAIVGVGAVAGLAALIVKRASSSSSSSSDMIAGGGDRTIEVGIDRHSRSNKGKGARPTVMTAQQRKNSVAMSITASKGRQRLEQLRREQEHAESESEHDDDSHSDSLED